MRLTPSEKTHVLKTFTDFLKKVNGKGPKNIHIKFYDSEMHVIMEGVVSDFEKYLIKNFGQEAIDTFESFYQRDSINAEKEFMEMLKIDHKFKFYELITNFEDDCFIYKMKYI
jgi:uncharacterized protein YbcI